MSQSNSVGLQKKTERSENFILQLKLCCYWCDTLKTEDKCWYYFRLSNLVETPKIVRKLSWVENLWPEESVFERPNVQKYCLMGVKDSYTDFHIDFGGTSVWYHVLRVRGKTKSYYYSNTDCRTHFPFWYYSKSLPLCLFRARKSSTWFPPLQPTWHFLSGGVPHLTRMRCSLETRLICATSALSNKETLCSYQPVRYLFCLSQNVFSRVVSLNKLLNNNYPLVICFPGWIHAVLTPVDCLAFGGNFLHSLNIDMQLRLVSSGLFPY